MNRYNIQVKGNDMLGITFIKTIVELANKGAVLLDEDFPVRNTFPHSAMMFLETEEFIENTPFTLIHKIQEHFNKEQLEALEWEDFRSHVKNTVGITGRDRSLMMTKYLKLTGQDGKADIEE